MLNPLCSFQSLAQFFLAERLFNKIPISEVINNTKL